MCGRYAKGALPPVYKRALEAIVKQVQSRPEMAKPLYLSVDDELER